MDTARGSVMASVADLVIGSAHQHLWVYLVISMPRIPGSLIVWTSLHSRWSGAVLARED